MSIGLNVAMMKAINKIVVDDINIILHDNRATLLAMTGLINLHPFATVRTPSVSHVFTPFVFCVKKEGI
jgi:hypothetical protein